jgi:hypothetical protein
MATVYNLAIDQGTTYSVTVTVSDNTGTARNLTGYTGRAQLRKSYYTNSNTAFTVAISNPGEGEVTLSLTATQTSALKAGRYVYDLELVANATSTVERIVEGIVTVYPEATK